MPAAFNPLDHPLALQNPGLITDSSAWLGHIPFGMALIGMARPRILVELGTLRGDSYCGFCQAIAAAKLDTKAFAIDTWAGDIHTGNLPAQYLKELRAHHDPLYGRFSTLIQSDFDSAVSRFADNSIDLLHIDGCHTYDAVKHDYETWLPKLSERAVVLFHDSAERGGDFGVFKFWGEINRGFPHYEFPHAHGLGILAFGKSAPQSVLDFIAAANANPAAVNLYFAVLGHRLEMFKVANTLITSMVNIHQTIEQWHHKHNEGLTPIPHPVRETGNFANRILLEVQTLASRAP